MERANSSCTISCLARAGRKAAPAALILPTISTAPLPTLRSATWHSSWSPARLSRRSKPSSSAWAGTSNGSPRSAATSTSTTTCRFLLTKSAPRASTTTQRKRSEATRCPGASVFYKDPTGAVFHTYSAYARGLDILIGAYNWLDLTPKGRDEAELPWAMAWVRRHDEYGEDAQQPCCGSHPDSSAA